MMEYIKRYFIYFLIGLLFYFVSSVLFHYDVKAAAFPKPTKIQAFDSGGLSTSSMTRYTNWDGKSGYRIGPFIQTSTALIPRSTYFFFDNVHLSKVNTSIILYLQIYHPDSNESPITITSVNYEDYTTSTYYACSVGNKQVSYNVYTTYTVNCSIPSFYNGNFNFNAVETNYKNGSSYYIGLATDDSSYVVSPSNSDVLTGINGLGTDINNSANNIISSNNQNSQNIINNQNENANKIDNSINDVNNSINDSSTDDPTGSFDSFNDKIATNGVITNLITLPITLFTNVLNNINGTCKTFNIGNLFGSNLSFPCIDLSNYFGPTLWNVIDVLFSGFFVLIISKKMIRVFENFSSMREGDVLSD
ncbi:MAG: hypothetical protein J6D28_05220 [Bacilli bacterium]|nr:hypothetical protein [Bacilli bacterium]